MLTIPGRPQSKDRGADGRLLDAAKTYVDTVRRYARERAQQPTDQALALDIEFIYTSDRDLQTLDWPNASIPNPDTAHQLALRALVGTVVQHRTQFNPITVTRTVLKPEEAAERYGSPDGATIITWTAET